jgi:peptide/nickel transport system substrate-binding protein
MLEFKSMTLDGSNTLSTRTLQELMADSNFTKNYHARFTDAFAYSYIAMNNRPDGVKHPKLFNDRGVRRAMALLTPLDIMNTIVNGGKNKRMPGPVSILKAEFDTTLKPLPNDTAEARKLLSQSGWNDSNGDGILDKMIDGKNLPFEFTITYHINAPEWKDYAVLLQEAYNKAGMRVNLMAVDMAVMLASARKHDFDMFLGSMGQSSAPEDFTQLWHSSSWISEGSNYSGFGNAASDALIDSLSTITDMAKRLPLVHRLQKMIYDEQPVIFMFSGLRRNVIHKRFRNAEMYFERPGILLNNLVAGDGKS